METTKHPDGVKTRGNCLTWSYGCFYGAEVIDISLQFHLSDLLASISSPPSTRSSQLHPERLRFDTPGQLEASDLSRVHSAVSPRSPCLQAAACKLLPVGCYLWAAACRLLLDYTAILTVLCSHLCNHPTMDTQEPAYKGDDRVEEVDLDSIPAHQGPGMPSRKRRGDYSENPHSKKSRDRLASMTDHERWLHQKKNADGVAALRARRKMETSSAYAEASDSQKPLLLAQAESDCVRRR